MYRVLKPFRFPVCKLQFSKHPIQFRSYMHRILPTSVTLNETESKIKKLLLDFCTHYNTNKDASSHLVLRITGGWVRDKLLGDESQDLDIAINHLSGEEFVSELSEFVKTHHPDLVLKAAHIIKKNPEKSKHLETCTTKIYDRDIDFVNLRSEKYTTDSRIPVIECGTAEEDALRRDATLNALFYNLNEDKIEDFTGKGLDDLSHGILRTPLLPLQTFLDDPLRVLRLIRFASRFDFTIEKDTLEAMRDSEIKRSLSNKISRERVGVELEKILNGRNPSYGLRLLNHVQITDNVFSVGTIQDKLGDFNPDKPVYEYYEILVDGVCKQVNASTSLLTVFQSSLSANTTLYKATEGVSPRLFWLTVVLAPFKNFHLAISKKKSVTTHVPEIIVKEGLRFGKQDFDPVSTVLKHMDYSKEIFNKTVQGTIKRSELGLYLREFGVHANLNLLVNCFQEVIDAIHIPESQEVPLPTAPNSVDPNNEELAECMAKYEQVAKVINQLNLQEVHQLKPLLDGRAISKALDKKGGPWMAPVTREVLIWQLDHPEGTREQCLEALPELEKKTISQSEEK